MTDQLYQQAIELKRAHNELMAPFVDRVHENMIDCADTLKPLVVVLSDRKFAGFVSFLLEFIVIAMCYLLLGAMVEVCVPLRFKRAKESFMEVIRLSLMFMLFCFTLTKA